MTGLIAAQGLTLLLVKVLDIGILAIQGSQKARAEHARIKSAVDKELAQGKGLPQAFIDAQTADIEALEKALFENPEGM